MENVSEADFDARVFGRTDVLTVAYFWGNQCPNCEVFARHWPALEEELRGEPVRFLKIDAYRNEALATRFGLHGVPTFLMIRGDRVLGRMTSFRGDDFFLAVIRERIREAA